MKKQELMVEKKINGRKRHALTDRFGLVWAVGVTSANTHDGTVGRQLVEPFLGYLHRLKKIVADMAYKKVFAEWVDTLPTVELDVSSAPPSSDRGFVPLPIRWVTERTFAHLNCFRRLDKDHEKKPKSQETWILLANCQIILNRISEL